VLSIDRFINLFEHVRNAFIELNLVDLFDLI
jgi:hypothetical protein